MFVGGVNGEGDVANKYFAAYISFISLTPVNMLIHICIFDMNRRFRSLPFSAVHKIKFVIVDPFCDPGNGILVNFG